MRALVEEELELLEGIAVDHDQVGQRPRRDRAELALLAQDLGADSGGLADDLDRLQHLGAMDELQALVDLRQVNLSGVIVGKALYEDRFTVGDAQRVLDR